MSKSYLLNAENRMALGQRQPSRACARRLGVAVQKVDRGVYNMRMAPFPKPDCGGSALVWVWAGARREPEATMDVKHQRVAVVGVLRDSPVTKLDVRRQYN
jgi:hypothetical protein